MPVSLSPESAPGLIGTELGVSEWFLIDQSRIDAFADATLDHQFIHVDPDKAKLTPFGGTIAHGFLTLSLLPHLVTGLRIGMEGAVMGLNYGFDKIRFLAPVKVDSRVRARARLVGFQEKASKQFLITQEITIEIENEPRPALVSQWLTMIMTG